MREVHKSDGLDSAKFAGAAVGAAETAGDPARLPGILEGLESDLPKHDKAARFMVAAGSTTGTTGSLLTAEARVAATGGESVGINGLHQVLESARSSLFHESSLARSCADGDESCAAGVVSVSAASGVASLPAGRSLTYARAAANACGEVARGSNSCSDTAINSLRVQRATSYNPQGVVAHNSRRKVRLSSTVGSRSVEQTVDMSPAPAAGTCRRSADTVHVQRQVPRKRRAESSGGRSWSWSWSWSVGPVWLVECRASLRPAWRFLAHW